MFYGPVLHLMALSYVLWPCPMSYGPVVCLMVPWPCPMAVPEFYIRCVHGQTLARCVENPLVYCQASPETHLELCFLSVGAVYSQAFNYAQYGSVCLWSGERRWGLAIERWAERPWPWVLRP